MGYTCETTVKVIRSKHRVTFSEHTTIESFIRDLKSIPGGATFDEIEWAVNGLSYIEFHHEKLDPAHSEQQK